MTEAEFVKIAGREPTELERRVNGIPKLDEAGQPMLVEGVVVCPHCGQNPFGHSGWVTSYMLGHELPDSEGGEA